MSMKNASRANRTGSGLHLSAIGFVVAGCAIALATMLDAERRAPARAADEPPTSKEDSIARVERLGGKVRIDGEKPAQPVWSVDFQAIAIAPQDLRLLASFPDLESLNLADTPLDDEGLKYVAASRRLKELDLSGTKITDAGLSRLVELKELTMLRLNRTAITDAGLLNLAPLKKLSPPAVFETPVSEAGLQRLDAAKRTSELAKGQVMDAGLPQMKAISTDDARRWNQLGRAGLIGARGDEPARDRAVMLLERAVQAEPTNDDFKLDLADAYVSLDLELTSALAVGLYEDVLRRRPDDLQLLGRLVNTYSALGNTSRAFEYAERRLKTAPTIGAYDVALQVVGIVAIGGKVDRGLAIVRQAGERNPDDPGIRLLRATLEIQAKNYPEATSVLRKVVEDSSAADPCRAAAVKLLTDMEKTR